MTDLADITFIDSEDECSNSSRNIISNDGQHFASSHNSNNAGRRLSVITTTTPSSDRMPEAVTVTLILPNIVNDNDDAGSVHENDSESLLDNFYIPAMEELNNLNKDESCVKNDLLNKYYIPEIDAPSKVKYSTEHVNSFTKRGSVAGVMDARGSGSVGAAWLGSSTGLERSGSMSSIASNVSQSINELTNTANESTASATSTKSKSSTKKRHTHKPRIKSNFAFTTLQYIQERLTGHIFSGWVEERRRLETMVRGGSGNSEGSGQMVAGWRDVVEVDACETVLVRQLDAVMASVPGAKEGKKWINITSPTLVHGYLLWVLLPQPQPPGHYWLQVTAVTSHDTLGLQLQLAVLRSVGLSDGESTESRARRQAAAAATECGDLPLTFTLLWDNATAALHNVFGSDAIRRHIAAAINPTNIFMATRYLLLASISLIVGCLHAGQQAVHLLLRFIQEFGILIDRSTPLMQTLLAFVEKIVGGFFLLVAMLYRDIMRKSPPPPPPGAAVQAIRFTAATPAPPQQQGRRHVTPQDWHYH